MFEGNRVHARDVDAAISKIEFLLLPDGRTTLCTLTLDNGFTVHGMAACVDRANYDKTTGEDNALQKAKDKVWELLGFRLADMLVRAAVTKAVMDAPYGKSPPC